jgi:hypothetical protein
MSDWIQDLRAEFKWLTVRVVDIEKENNRQAVAIESPACEAKAIIAHSCDVLKRATARILELEKENGRLMRAVEDAACSLDFGDDPIRVSDSLFAAAKGLP